MAIRSEVLCTPHKARRTYGHGVHLPNPIQRATEKGGVSRTPTAQADAETKATAISVPGSHLHRCFRWL